MGGRWRTRYGHAAFHGADVAARPLDPRHTALVGGGLVGGVEGRLAVAIRGDRIDGRAAVDEDMGGRRPTVVGEHGMEDRAQAGAGHDVGRVGAEADDARSAAVAEEVIAADVDGASGDLYLGPGFCGGVACDERVTQRDRRASDIQAAAVLAGDVSGHGAVNEGDGAHEVCDTATCTFDSIGRNGRVGRVGSG